MSYSVILSDGTREREFVGGPDGIYLVEISPPLIARENTYAQGSDAEGRQRVRSVAPNPEGSLRVRVDQSAGDEVDLYADLHDFQDLVESAHREKGWLKLTPTEGEAVTFDLESIRISDFPHDVGLIRSRRAEITVEYECLPYGRLDPVTVFSGEVITGPSDSVELDLSNITSHTDLYGELTLTDTSTQHADHIEVGLEQDYYDPASPSAFLIDSTDLNAIGSGATATRSGAYNGASNNVIRATLSTTPTFVCSTDAQFSPGKRKIRARVYPSSPDVLVRFVWQVGAAGSYRREDWVAVPGEDGFFDLALAVIDTPELPLTGDYWIGYIEAKSQTGYPTLDVDLLEVLPAQVYAKAEGLLTPGEFTGGLVAGDDFDSHTAGALSTKTPPLVPAGTWTESGDADDFSINTTYACATRSAVSDANVTNGGQFVRCGSGVASEVTVQADIHISGTPTAEPTVHRWGIFARYVDTSNWLMVSFDNRYVKNVALGGYVLRLMKCIAGTVTVLGEVHYPASIYLSWRTVKLYANATGDVVVWEGVLGSTPQGKLLVLGDTDLDTASTLDDGGYGLYDANTTATAFTRYYDNFSVTVPTSTQSLSQHALWSGQDAVFRHDMALTKTSVGYGRVPVFSGQHLRIPPATLNQTKSRLVIKRRRNANDQGFADTGLTDNMTATLAVTPRVVLTGG